MSENIGSIIDQYFPEFEEGLKKEIEISGLNKKFKAGSLLMNIGEEISHIPLVYDGTVRIFREDEQGNELLLYYLEPGDSCAISLVCSGREQYARIKAIAIDQTRAIMIPINLMDSWMHKYKSWYYFVLETYRLRLEEALQTIDSIAFKKMDERLIHHLRKKSEALNTLVIKVTHQDLAFELNTSREVVSRLLKKLEQKKMIALSRNSIKIINLIDAPTE